MFGAFDVTHSGIRRHLRVTDLPGDPDQLDAVIRAAIASQPKSAQGLLTRDRVLASAIDHVFGHGWHIGWVWGSERTRGFLDVISEHRMTSAWVTRFWLDGEEESLPAPGSMRMSSDDPDEDARLEREFVERQRTVVDDLRRRGLLLPLGESLPALDINEVLRTGRLDDQNG